MVENNLCKQHSGLTQSIKNFQWTIGILVLICMGVIAFLWNQMGRNNTSIWLKVDSNHQETMGGIKQLSDKVIIIDYKVQRHLDETDFKKGEKK